MSDIPKQHAIALCTLGRPGAMVSMWWARALAGTVWPFNVVKAIIPMEDDLGNKIAEGRNKLVKLILGLDTPSTEFKWIAWQDDDVIPISPLWLRALYSHADEADIISGVYFSKETFPQPLIFPAKGQGTKVFEPDRCFEAWGCGMGLTMVSVDLYRRMEAKGLPEDSLGNPEWYRTPGRNEDLIVHERVMSVGGTEDLYFCDKAGELGAKVLIDTGKHAFGFHYDSERRVGYPIPQWQTYRKREPVVWDTPDGLVEWR